MNKRKYIGSKTIGKLPERFQWTLHNVVAHPLSELLYQVSVTAERLSNAVHDKTIPYHEVGTGRG